MPLDSLRELHIRATPFPVSKPAAVKIHPTMNLREPYQQPAKRQNSNSSTFYC